MVKGQQARGQADRSRASAVVCGSLSPLGLARSPPKVWSQSLKKCDFLLCITRFYCNFKVLTEVQGGWGVIANTGIVELTSDEIGQVGGGIWVTDIWIISGNEIWVDVELGRSAGGGWYETGNVRWNGGETWLTSDDI